MKTNLLAIGLLILASFANSAIAAQVTSPDGRIIVRVAQTDAGALTYAITLADRVVLEPSPLGIAMSCGSWTQGLEIVDTSAVESAKGSYHLTHGKRRECSYVANRVTLTVRNGDGQRLTIVFHVSDDGVAFRYELPECGDAKSADALREVSGFDFPQSTRAWLMPMDEGNSGWGGAHPAYERFYEIDIPVTQASPTSVGWAFPALFHVENTAWVLVSESNVTPDYCASRLSSPNDHGQYHIEFPDPRENKGAGPAQPNVALPFASPWRVVMLGESPAAIVESTLITDLAAPSEIADASFVVPGRSTWSWLPEKNEATVFERQKDYVDLAAKLGFEYCLVDALWDKQIGYEKMAELVTYAKQRGVAVLLWYNSNGNWNDVDQTPLNRMHTHEVRMEEFARLKQIGVKGVKIDFFGGDKQVMMQLYRDILKDAAGFDMLVNFHGSTIPRGWERTWPNLVSMEGVRGYEFFTFKQEGADVAAQHCTILPFTRNAIGPMDFTPTMLGKYLNTKHTVERRTRDAFDLAESVVYASGIQHFGVTPDDVAQAPEFVVDFLRALPPVWDDVHFVAGFPGKYAVIARRTGDRWFVAGLNGSDEPLTLDCDITFIAQAISGSLIVDDPASDKLLHRTIESEPASMKLELAPRGGFVLQTKP